MNKRIKENIPQTFDTLFKVLSNQKFLDKDGLGGEIAFFIQSFFVEQQLEVDLQIQSLIKRLASSNVNILEINLYHLCIEILEEENLLLKILEQEKKMHKNKLIRVLSSPLNIDTKIIPEIRKRMENSLYNIIFITGVGAAFPVIRSHSILNNLQTLIDQIPLVMFFPGTYNNKSLTLFDKLKDDNYYRAHNLNDYKI
jgi:hypothetical protein